MKIEEWQKESKWSRKYDKCVVCGTTEIKYNGNGMCKICYNRKWLEKNPEKLKGYRIDTKRWRERNSDSESYKKINRERTKKWQKENPEKNGIWRKENPEKIKKYSIVSKKWTKENPEKIKEYQNRYIEKNPEKVKMSRRIYRKRKIDNDFHFKLKCRISTSVCQRLKKRLSSKKSKSTFDFLPYTIDELKQHLENLFEPWMTWENWGIGKGCWNIDHKRPDCSFDYKNVEDKEFQECWALKNLQPLSSIENIKKGGKITNLK